MSILSFFQKNNKYRIKSLNSFLLVSFPKFSLVENKRVDKKLIMTVLVIFLSKEIRRKEARRKELRMKEEWKEFRSQKDHSLFFC